MLRADDVDYGLEELRPKADFKPLTEGLPLWRLAYSPELVRLSQIFDEIAEPGLDTRSIETDFSADDDKKVEFRVEHIKRKHFLKRADEFNQEDRHTAYLALADNCGQLLLPSAATVVGFRHSKNDNNGDHFFEFELDPDDGASLKVQSQTSFFVAQAIAGVNPGTIRYTSHTAEIRAAFVNGAAPDSLADKVEGKLTDFMSNGPFEVDLSAAPQVLAATAFDIATKP